MAEFNISSEKVQAVQPVGKNVTFSASAKTSDIQNYINEREKNVPFESRANIHTADRSAGVSFVNNKQGSNKQQGLAGYFNTQVTPDSNLSITGSRLNSYNNGNRTNQNTRVSGEFSSPKVSLQAAYNQLKFGNSPKKVDSKELNVRFPFKKSNGFFGVGLRKDSGRNPSINFSFNKRF